MTRGFASGLMGSAAALALTAAAQPSALGQAQPGLWEVGGLPGAAAAVRQCLADLAVLARFEHRARNCTSRTVREGGASAEIDYSCGASGFGHSDVTVITPRSLRIATQGISEGLPFNYVIQARRIADCPTSSRH